MKFLNVKTSCLQLSLPQFGQVHASHPGSHRHPEVPQDVRGKETLQAEAGRRSGNADHPPGLHGTTEVPGGKMHVTLGSFLIA